MKVVGVSQILIECPINIGTITSYVSICYDGVHLTLVDQDGHTVGGVGGSGGSCCEPLTNGDLTNPELIFANGDVIMVG